MLERKSAHPSEELTGKTPQGRDRQAENLHQVGVSPLIRSKRGAAQLHPFWSHR